MASNGTKQDKRLTGFIVYALFASGLVLILLSTMAAIDWKWDQTATTFIRDLGVLLAAVMGVSILYEMYLREEFLRQFCDELDHRLHTRVPTLDKIATEFDTKVPKLGQIAAGTAERVHELFSQNFPGMIGLQIAVQERRTFSRYYAWSIEPKAQELFFAGRSVLNRIDEDLRYQQKRGVVDVILQRLSQGSMIWIDFLDPRCNILQRLAREEGGDNADSMIGDIARSIEICQQLAVKLQQQAPTLPTSAQLQVRMFDQIPYFAYHRQDSDVLVGFYFQASRGDRSPAYELAGDATKKLFGEHFDQIHKGAVRLIDFTGSRRDRYRLNKDLFDTLKHFLLDNLPPDKAEGFMDWSTLGPRQDET